MRLIGHDELADGLGQHHDLAHGLAGPLVRRLEQNLRDDRDEAICKKGLGLLALIVRQRIDDAIDGLGGAGGMQGPQHQVPGFGGRHGHGNGFGVAHFTDQDNVGVFAHRARTPSAKDGRCVPNSRCIT